MKDKFSISLVAHFRKFNEIGDEFFSLKLRNYETMKVRGRNFFVFMLDLMDITLFLRRALSVIDESKLPPQMMTAFGTRRYCPHVAVKPRILSNRVAMKTNLSFFGGDQIESNAMRIDQPLCRHCHVASIDPEGGKWKMGDRVRRKLTHEALGATKHFMPAPFTQECFGRIMGKWRGMIVVSFAAGLRDVIIEKR